MRVALHERPRRTKAGVFWWQWRGEANDPGMRLYWPLVEWRTGLGQDRQAARCPDPFHQRRRLIPPAPLWPSKARSQPGDVGRTYPRTGRLRDDTWAARRASKAKEHRWHQSKTRR